VYRKAVEIKRFSIECHKTKTKAITLASHSSRKQHKEPIKLKASTCNRRRARENACKQGTLGFGLTSDWSRSGPYFFKPITERRNAKSKQQHMTFEPQL